MKKPNQQTCFELDDNDLRAVIGATTRRSEDFGDPIGNYNFRVEIDGVDAGQFADIE